MRWILFNHRQAKQTIKPWPPDLKAGHVRGAWPAITSSYSRIEPFEELTSSVARSSRKVIPVWLYACSCGIIGAMKKQSTSRIYRPCLVAATLLAGTILLSACSSTATTESIEKSLEQTTVARKDVASIALAHVGDAYMDHMAGPQQFDNSGQAYFAYRQNGRKLPRSLADQLQAGLPVSLSEAEPGDLVFFRIDTTDGRGQLRVGVIVDRNVAVIALPGQQDKPGSVQKIALTDHYWSQRLVGVSHILPAR